MVMASVNLNLHQNWIDNSWDHEFDVLFYNGMLLSLTRQAYQWVMQLLLPLFGQANLIFVVVDAMNYAAVYFWPASEQANGWFSHFGQLF